MKNGICDSCGKQKTLSKAKIGNKVFNYCDGCKTVHERELNVNNGLKELAKTHPNEANDPQFAGMLHHGKTVEEVKKYIETHKKPGLDAEVL